ncbi:MAG: hypothetical protein ABR568_14580 [Pyrinomonadaceae bacterium]
MRASVPIICDLLTETHDGNVDVEIRYPLSFGHLAVPSVFQLTFYDPLISSCAEDGFISLEPRILKLRVAVLENVSSQPIRIGNFLVRKFTDETLRSREEEETSLKALNAEQHSLFPLETLGPRERLVLPLDMPMVYPKDNYEPSPNSNTLSTLRRKLASGAVVTVPAGESGEIFALESGRLLELLNKPQRNQMREKELRRNMSSNPP